MKLRLLLLLMAAGTAFAFLLPVASQPNRITVSGEGGVRQLVPTASAPLAAQLDALKDRIIMRFSAAGIKEPLVPVPAAL